MMDPTCEERSRFSYDASRLPDAYDIGRGLSPESIQLWHEVITRHIRRPINGVCDLGCGTGRFSGLLGSWFQTKVYGVDPSVKMLNQARERWGDDLHMHFCLGSAEAIPLTHPVSMIFMSNSLHHVVDHDRFISEVQRTLRSEGYLVIRNMVSHLQNSEYGVNFWRIEKGTH